MTSLFFRSRPAVRAPERAASRSLFDRVAEQGPVIRWARNSVRAADVLFLQMSGYLVALIADKLLQPVYGPALVRVRTDVEDLGDISVGPELQPGGVATRRQFGDLGRQGDGVEPDPVLPFGREGIEPPHAGRREPGSLNIIKDSE